MLIQFHYYKFEDYINFKNLRLSILKTHDEYYNLKFDFLIFLMLTKLDKSKSYPEIVPS